MAGLTIRAAGSDDVDAVLAFWRAAAVEPSTTDDRPAVEGLLDRDPGSLLLAEEDGELVGTLIAAWDGWRGHLYRLAVHPDRRRSGTARALVTEGERRLRARGARKVQGIVLRENDEGRAFWEATGYAWDDRVVRHTKTFPLP